MLFLCFSLYIPLQYINQKNIIMFKSIMTLFLCFSTSLFLAQDQDISDKELSQFADAFQQVRFINQSSQQDMVKVLEDEDITVEKFICLSA